MTELELCVRCGNTGTRRWASGSVFCSKHWRFNRMRYSARADGKTVPSFEQLEEMSRSMVCHCGRVMYWLSTDGPVSQQASLQHDRSGVMRLLCRACNTKHSDCPGDEFYTVPEEHRFCGQCKKLKPCSEFHVSRARPTGLASCCKACTSLRAKDERVSKRRRELRRSREAGKRTEVNARMKAWRAANKDKQAAINQRAYLKRMARFPIALKSGAGN